MKRLTRIHGLEVFFEDLVNFNQKNSGTMIIIIGFAGCLYPLWPSQLRGGVYYLSWGGLGFVGFVIVLAICKFFYTYCYRLN